MHRYPLRHGLLAALLLACVSLPALACGLAWKQSGYAVTLSEEALISWNPATHVEHFVRRANFEADKPDLGFLVPTPTVPTISAIDQKLFGRLQSLIQPVPRARTDWYPSLLLWLLRPMYIGSADRAKASSSLQVIEQKQVAGYEVTVLKAGNAGELRQWLQQRGYAVRPGLEAWLKPYLKRHWAITAFKLSKPRRDEGLQLEAVDMRFITRRPFYPYREPLDGANDAELGQASPERSLRLYAIAPGPLNPVFDEDRPELYGDEDQNSVLQNVYGMSGLLYAAPINQASPQEQHQADAQAQDGLQALKLPPALAQDLPAKPWLNAWVDGSHRRVDPLAGEPASLAELYFYPARRQEPYLPIDLTVHERVLPLDLLALAGFFFWCWRRRRRLAAA